MSEVLTFKRPNRQYEYSKETYLFLILDSLEKLHPGDAVAKARYIATVCPFISIGRLAQFNDKVSQVVQEIIEKRMHHEEQFAQLATPSVPSGAIIYPWMIR